MIFHRFQTLICNLACSLLYYFGKIVCTSRSLNGRYHFPFSSSVELKRDLEQNRADLGQPDLEESVFTLLGLTAPFRRA